MHQSSSANGRHPLDLAAVNSRFIPEPAHKHVRLTPVGDTGGKAAEHDAALDRSVRRAAWMRQGFYVVVLIVAMAGQVTGAVEALHIPLIAAVPAVAALELGGVVVLANADVRRRLGERAVASRLLSVAIAGWAAAFNWLAHGNHLLGGFYAGMSALGYAVWLMHTENQRRDRLRATGDLPPTTPAYELWGHWLRHPLVTVRAKSLAKRDPRLGLYGSIDAATTQTRTERRDSAIAKVLHRKIRAAVDPTTADIAVRVYDLDKIARQLADDADYVALTELVAADLSPDRLGVATLPPPADPESAGEALRLTATPDSPAGEPELPDLPTPAEQPLPLRPANRRRPNRTSRVAAVPSGASASVNAAELRRRYPDDLPSDTQIRKATGWSPGRVKNARAAYDAGADL